MTLLTRDGQAFFHEELARRGSPENPVSEAEVQRTFRENADSLLSADEADRIIAAVSEFERLPDASDLLAILGVDRRARDRKEAA